MILYVFGAGISAIETLEDSATLHEFDNFVFIEDSPHSNKINMFGGAYDLISLEQFRENVSYDNPLKINAIITPVNAKYKQKIYELFPDLDYVNCISENTNILSDDIGKGFDARAFAFVGSTAKIGNFVKIGYHCLVADNCSIGDYSFLSASTSMCAGSNVGIGSMIYSHAVIIPGVTVGNNTIIGAGSVVTKDIGDSFVAYGNPCKVVKGND